MNVSVAGAELLLASSRSELPADMLPAWLRLQSVCKVQKIKGVKMRPLPGCDDLYSDFRPYTAIFFTAGSTANYYEYQFNRVLKHS